TPEVRALKDQPRPKDRPPLFVSEIRDQTDTPSANGTALVPSKLKQTYLQVPPQHKDAFVYILLLHLLTADSQKSTSTPNQVIIFTNRTQTADMLHRTLHKLLAITYQSADPSHALINHLKPTTVTSLSSALPQSQRTSNLASFRASTARALISTDLSSRGLDIPTCTHVINFDVPRDPVDYVHRVGRTARAGRSGTSVTFVSPRDVELVLAVEDYLGEKMSEWKSEGEEVVNVETRVVRGRTLKDVGECRMEALREIESGKDVKGYRGKIRKKR
ncbi:putative RNA helicase, partial [Lithohypha guttulata]